jgi:hypothetical protein
MGRRRSALAPAGGTEVELDTRATLNGEAGLIGEVT